MGPGSPRAAEVLLQHGVRLSPIVRPSRLPAQRTETRYACAVLTGHLINASTALRRRTVAALPTIGRCYRTRAAQAAAVTPPASCRLLRCFLGRNPLQAC